MKKYILFALLLIGSVSAMAQRGTYGTYAPFDVVTPTIYNNSLVAKAADSLKGVDTVYLYFQLASAYKAAITLQTVQKADSLSGIAILQTWAGLSTGWVTRTGYWESITGITGLCTTCVGASKTYTLATGTTRSTWDIGQADFGLWRVRIVGTRSTDTTAITGFATISY